MNIARGNWDSVIAGTYANPKIKLTSGFGSRVVDDSGKSYLDFLAGIAVNSLGHGHPAIVEAVSRQSGKLGHVSNLYANPVSEQLADKLLNLISFTDGRIFFCNSGAEANEAAIKYVRAAKPKSRLLSLEGGFHGRTIGALSITGQIEKREPFQPLLQKIDFIEPNNIRKLKSISRKTGGIWLEIIQGEGGVLPLTDDYLSSVSKRASELKALLVVDEVQTGIGRTGNWFAFQDTELKPDLVPMAKGLGGGLPIGALAISKDYKSAIRPGGHGTTYGGNPIAAAASLAVLQTIESQNLLENVNVMSDLLRMELSTLPGLSEVRGKGLLLGLVFDRPIAKDIESAALHLGLLINAVRSNVIRLAPPLNISKSETLEAVQILQSAVKQVE
jgi:acetylornithine/N-succinyldiaminopimelate aminotransferase